MKQAKLDVWIRADGMDLSRTVSFPAFLSLALPPRDVIRVFDLVRTDPRTLREYRYAQCFTTTRNAIDDVIQTNCYSTRGHRAVSLYGDLTLMDP